MTSKSKKRASEHLQRVIEMCKAIEDKGVDPFNVNIDDLITVIREYFPEWKSPAELCLDAETLHRVASIIKLQGDWVKHRSTSLYTDPFILEEKIRRLDNEELASLFLRIWHPIIELEQITRRSLDEATKYWKNLLPLSERWQLAGSLETKTGVTTREELIKQRILAEKPFKEELEVFWEELKQKVSRGTKVHYWDFVGADTYSETIRRAYMTSFLITYGYATLELHPLEEEIFIKPFEEQRTMVGKQQLVSIPISIGFHEWTKWKGGAQT